MSVPVWTFFFDVAGRKGGVRNVNVSWRESVSLRSASTSYRSATVTAVLPFSVDDLVSRYSAAAAQGTLVCNGAAVLSGGWRDVSYEPAQDGVSTLVTVTLTESGEEDRGVFPPVAGYSPVRNANDVFLSWESYDYWQMVENGEGWRVGYEPNTESFGALTAVENQDGRLVAFGPVKRLRSEIYGDLTQPSDGQTFPYVIGKAGVRPQYPVTEYVPGAPAYWINETSTPGGGELPQVNGGNAALLVHAGPTTATEVSVFGIVVGTEDDLGRADGLPIETAIVDGGTIAYVSTAWGTSSPDDIRKDPNLRFWTTWPEECTPGAAGDLLTQVYAASTVRVDLAEFQRVAPALNRYILAGVLTEDVVPTDFAQSALLPILPVEVVPGPFGLRPVLAPWFDTGNDDPGVTVIAGVGVSRAGPCQLPDAAQVGIVEVQCAPRVDTGAYGRVARASAATSPLVATATATRVDRVQTDFVSDQATSYLIAADRLRAQAWAPRRVRYAITDHDAYGVGGTVELYPGRRVTLTDGSIYVSGKRGVVSEREISGESALIVIDLLDSNLDAV